MATKARTLHAKKRSRDYDRKRGTASQRGYGAAHRALRRSFAAETPAICNKCGEALPSKFMHMDHIVPMSKGGSATDRANRQWLCQPCHSKKTVLEDGGFGFDSKIVAGRGKESYVSIS